MKRRLAGRRAGLAVLLLSTTALAGIVTPARAADTTWTGANGNNDWFFTGNWDTGSIPTAADNVFINTDQGSNFPAIVNTNADAGNVNIGNSATGFLGISNAALDATTMAIGNGALLGIQGLLNVVAGGAVTTSGDFIVGNSSYGIASFSGAHLTVGGDAYVAFGDGAAGQLIFSNGAAGNFTGSGGLTIGKGHNGSNGTLTINTGADVDVLNLLVGAYVGSTGTVYVEDAGSTLDIGAYLVVGGHGTGTLNINNSGQVTVANNSNPVEIGASAGSNGTVNVSGGGVLFLGNNALAVGGSGTGALNISSAGAVVTSQFSIGDHIGGTGTVTVSDNGSHLLSTGDGTIGIDGNGTLIIANGGLVSLDGGAGTLTIAANVGSIGHLFIGDTGVAAGVLNAAAVEFGAGVGLLTFNHTDTDYTFAADISGTGTIFQLAGATRLTGDASGFTGLTEVIGGSLYVNTNLGGPVNVFDGGTLGGNGAIMGDVSVGDGTLAPGNSIGILSVADITFNTGSTYEVELNEGGSVAGVNNDHISATGIVTINGGTVHVTPENGTDDGTTYTPGATYNIIQSFDSVVGTFDAVTDDYAFLNFYLWYDSNNVFLNSSLVTSFCLSGMTANQCATADGVFSLGAGGLLLAVSNLSDAEAPGALDQLSGEIHASARTALLEDSRFVREAALSRLDAAFKPVEQGDGPGVEDVAFWGRAFGSFGQWDGDGNAAAMDRDIGGFFLGGDAAVAGDIRLGLMGGYSRSTFHADDRASSGTADTWSLGAYAGGAWNAFSLKGGAAYSWHGVDTDRSVAFTGLSDSLSASYSARTAQVYGEAAYGIEAGSARFEPFANLAYVDLSTDGFTENGGEAALTASGDDANATITTLGLRAETAVTVGGKEATLRGMLGWRHAFGDVTPEQALAFAGGDAFTVAGVPIAEDALALDAGFDVHLAGSATLGLSYNGQFGSGFADHSAQASFGVKF